MTLSLGGRPCVTLSSGGRPCVTLSAAATRDPDPERPAMCDPVRGGHP